MIARMTTLMRAMLVSYLPMLIVLLLCTGLNAYAQTIETTVAAQPDALRAPPPPPEDEPPFNNAQFVSQSVPTTMTAGTTYQVSVTMGNLGNRTWTGQEGFTLGSRNPDENGIWGTNRVALWRDNLPGALITFTFNVTAPAAPGSYNFQWGMLQEGVQWFGPPTDNLVINVVAPARVNKAVIVSQSIPAQMVSGQTYPITMIMQNTGNTTWTAAAEYKFGLPWVDGVQLWNSGRVPLPATVPPGGLVTFYFNVTAPAAGNYNFYGMMLQEGVEWFDQATYTPVTVSNPAPANGAMIVSQSIPAQMNAGQNYPVTIVLQNTGTSTWTREAMYSLGTWGWWACSTSTAAGPRCRVPSRQGNWSRSVSRPWHRQPPAYTRCACRWSRTG